MRLGLGLESKLGPPADVVRLGLDLGLGLGLPADVMRVSGHLLQQRINGTGGNVCIPQVLFW